MQANTDKDNNSVKDSKDSFITRISPITLFVISVVAGIAAIVLSSNSIVILPYHLTILIGTLLIWPSFVSASNEVRELARYGLGTGTSSIGYWGTAVGVTATALAHLTGAFSIPVAIAGSFVIGLVTGICAQKIIKMKIPVMIQGSAMLATSTAIIATFLLAVSDAESTLLYPLIYIAITLAVLHPFNGSMGAGENLKRTLQFAWLEASMTTALFGFVILIAGYNGGLSMLAISIIGFVVFLRQWYESIKKDTYRFASTGFPEAEH